jgi:hypothetical protein
VSKEIIPKPEERQEIILGADRPLIGYQDERREIHLARNVELTIPQAKPTLPLECGNCEAHIVVFYELSTPNTVECPACGTENNLMVCINCEREHQEGDQAFIALDVPYGSTVHDSLFDGPAYACSANCLVEAFKEDRFDAKGMWPTRQKLEYSPEFARSSVEEFGKLICSLYPLDSPETPQVNQIISAFNENLTADRVTESTLVLAITEMYDVLIQKYPVGSQDPAVSAVHDQLRKLIGQLMRVKFK